jgi:SAM-dependent methyltransferase
LPDVHIRCSFSGLFLLASLTAFSQCEGRYTERQGSPDGIGKFYMGREIALTMSAVHADWLDRPERVQEEDPARLLAYVDAGPGEVIADIGCGTGYHALPMARSATGGTVFAVDVQPVLVDSVRSRASRAGLMNLVPVQASMRDVRLPPDSVDKVLMVDVYHELTFPCEVMGSVVRSMRSDGLLFLVEYRGEDEDVPIKEIHRMSREQCITEMRAAGLRLDRELNALPWQHCLVFRKP